MEQQPPDLAVETSRGAVRGHLVLLGFVPLSLLGGLLPSFSSAANLYVMLLGVTLMAAGFSQRVPRHPVPYRLPPGVSWWLVPAGVLVVAEGITYVLGSTHDYPTLSLLADPLLEGYLVRSAAYFGWLAAFWGLVRR